MKQKQKSTVEQTKTCKQRSAIIKLDNMGVRVNVCIYNISECSLTKVKTMKMQRYARELNVWCYKRQLFSILLYSLHYYFSRLLKIGFLPAL